MEALLGEAPAPLWGLLQLALAACGLLAGLVVLARPLHAPLRQALQPALVRIVTQQLVWVEWVQRASHPLLDTLAYISAASVSIEFYLSALPFMIWCGQQLLVFKLVCVLVLSSYITFGLKDILSSPRPWDVANALAAAATIAQTAGVDSTDSTDSKDGGSGRKGSIAAPQQQQQQQQQQQHVPRIRAVNLSKDIEDGLPSAHCALTVPMYLHAITCAVDNGLLPADWGLPLRIAALAWVALVAWGRLYLGVHSPLDLGVGSALGFCFLALWQQLEAPFVAWVLVDPNLPTWLLLASFAAMRLHPVATRFTHCYQYTTCWLGSLAGAVLGAWQCGLVENVAPIHKELWAAGGTTAFALLAAKLAAGLASVVAAKVVAKQLLLALLPPLFESVPVHVRQLWQPPVAFAPMEQYRSKDEAALAAKLAEVASAASSDDSTSSSSSSSSESDGVRVGVTVASLGTSMLVRTSSGGSKITVACNPAGLPWDVDTTARFLSYMAAVNTVWHFQAMWGAAGL